MARDEVLKQNWEALEAKLTKDFGGGEALNLDAIIYLIGVQEYGRPQKRFKKDDKVNLMHIAICKLLEPYGYYEFDYFDNEGWPHYQIKEKLPHLKAGEQSVLMKEAIVHYFIENNYLSTKNEALYENE
ncbi:hypothetical protein [Psychroflexus maritimus]|uniref:Uncharacterized protein n=1 Tax=Psychroflexus maritimus TaxID=2714865 RepID=A0A967AF53_9FLAO|nr:hypothetical protein [Psychroflexus maritimus]NGZ90610.1 hypothetical protein [Psychroflexus maritimus]